MFLIPLGYGICQRAEESESVLLIMIGHHRTSFASGIEGEK